MVLRITFFPFINLLVIVIAIAIGADDAFLLMFQYEKAKKVTKFSFYNLLKRQVFAGNRAMPGKVTEH
jgi:uncharacterized membrane protein YciS (DUF1049 family)